MSLIRTPAGSGLAIVAVILACLYLTASPCELPDGSISKQCEVTK